MKCGECPYSELTELGSVDCVFHHAFITKGRECLIVKGPAKKKLEEVADKLNKTQNVVKYIQSYEPSVAFETKEQNDEFWDVIFEEASKVV